MIITEGTRANAFLSLATQPKVRPFPLKYLIIKNNYKKNATKYYSRNSVNLPHPRGRHKWLLSRGRLLMRTVLAKLRCV